MNLRPKIAAIRRREHHRLGKLCILAVVHGRSLVCVRGQFATAVLSFALLSLVTMSGCSKGTDPKTGTLSGVIEYVGVRRDAQGTELGPITFTDVDSTYVWLSEEGGGYSGVGVERAIDGHYTFSGVGRGRYRATVFPYGPNTPFGDSTAFVDLADGQQILFPETLRVRSTSGLRAYPTPFASSVTAAFLPPAPSSPFIYIQRFGGVRQTDPYPNSAITWDGRELDGRAAPDGAYWAIYSPLHGRFEAELIILKR